RNWCGVRGAGCEVRCEVRGAKCEVRVRHAAGNKSAEVLTARIGAAALAVAFLTLAASAQQRPPSLDDGQTTAERMVMDTMAEHHMHNNPHLRLTVRRPERPGDRARAAAILAMLRP